MAPHPPPSHQRCLHSAGRCPRKWHHLPLLPHQRYLDSPIASPNHPVSHAQISDILKSVKHASLPAKVENSHHPVRAYQSQEAKRRRRRESHNMAERRRRDNINEKIQELSHLVPMHRLEDGKVRKHILNNSPLSPTLSPPSAPQPLSLTDDYSTKTTKRATLDASVRSNNSLTHRLKQSPVS